MHMSHQMSGNEAAAAERARTVAPPTEPNSKPARLWSVRPKEAAQATLGRPEPPDDASQLQTCEPTLSRKKLRVHKRRRAGRHGMAPTPANRGLSQLTRQHRGEILPNSFCHQLQLRAWESNATESGNERVQLRSGAARSGGLTFHSHRGSVRTHHWGGRQSVKGGLTEPRWASSHHFAAGESERTAAAAAAAAAAKKHPGKCSLSSSWNITGTRFICFAAHFS